MAGALYAAMSAGPKTKRARYEQQRNALVSKRQGGGWDGHWRDIGDFLMPRRTRFWTGDRNRGDRRFQNIIDSTGSYAIRTLESGMHAGLTSPARPWMKLMTPDPELAEFGPVKNWLHVVTQRMLTMFGQSNLYNSLPLVYGDMGLFGTGAVSFLPDEEDLFRTYSYPIGSYAVEVSKRGIVDTFYHEYEMTIRQCVKEFGVAPSMRDIDWSRFSTRIKDAWDKGEYEEAVTVGWLVQPNDDPRPYAIDANRRMKFTSCHFEIDTETRGSTADYRDNRFLRESGYNQFPVFVPRWRTLGNDPYGQECPGMSALGDVRQLQIMERKGGQLLAKVVDPPLKGPSSLRTQKTSLVQGDITYVDAREGQQGLEPIHEVRLEGYQYLTQKENEVRDLIRRAFYEDLFLMLAQSDLRQPITAREVEERSAEKMLVLGPVVERTNDDLLDPLVDRAYEMMDAVGMIPEPPPEVQGKILKVEYTSVLSQAQKLVGVVGQDRFVASVFPIIQIYPEARHKVKPFMMINGYADMLGVDPRQLNSDEEAQAAADEERQAQAQAAQAEQLAKLGAAARGGAVAPQPGSPLEAVVAGAGGQIAPAGGVA